MQPWYEAIDQGSRLRQGELVPDCPLLTLDTLVGESVPAPDLANPALEARKERSLAVVMSQDCDLEQNRVRYVVLCPCMTEQVYEEAWRQARQRAGRKHGDSAWRTHREVLPTTDQVNLMLLDPWPPGGEGVHFIVDMYEIHMLPRDWLEPAVQKRDQRWRLAQPYLQKLAQRFGNLYSRVAADEPTRLP